MTQKYANLEKEVFRIFGSSSWKNENILTVPSNYQSNASQEFIRINIIPNGSGLNLESLKGLLIIDIFVVAGKGPSRISVIADKLDLYLVGKSFIAQSGANLQFGNSSLSFEGLDKDSPTLYRAGYSIAFNLFGVI